MFCLSSKIPPLPPPSILEEFSFDLKNQMFYSGFIYSLQLSLFHLAQNTLLLPLPITMNLNLS